MGKLPRLSHRPLDYLPASVPWPHLPPHRPMPDTGLDIDAQMCLVLKGARQFRYVHDS